MGLAGGPFIDKDKPLTTFTTAQLDEEAKTLYLIMSQFGYVGDAPETGWGMGLAGGPFIDKPLTTAQLDEEAKTLY